MRLTASIHPKFCTAANLKSKTLAGKGFQFLLWLLCVLCHRSIHWWSKEETLKRSEPSLRGVEHPLCPLGFGRVFGALCRIQKFSNHRRPEGCSTSALWTMFAAVILRIQQIPKNFGDRGRWHFPQLEDQFQGKEIEQLLSTRQLQKFWRLFLLSLLF